MTAQLPKPAPLANVAIVDDLRRPTQAMAQWISTLDAAVRAFFGATGTGNPTGAPVVGQLTNAANDAAAALAGIPIGALYRNGSVVQIRVT